VYKDLEPSVILEKKIENEGKSKNESKKIMRKVKETCE